MQLTEFEDEDQLVGISSENLVVCCGDPDSHVYNTILPHGFKMDLLSKMTLESRALARLSCAQAQLSSTRKSRMACIVSSLREENTHGLL